MWGIGPLKSRIFLAVLLFGLIAVACNGRAGQKNRADTAVEALPEPILSVDDPQDGSEVQEAGSTCDFQTVAGESVGASSDTSQEGSIDLSNVEQRLVDAGLTEIVPDDTAILVHLVYATPDNFMGRVLYADLHRAYLLPEVAQMLYRAAEYLHHESPDLRLLIYDATRPMSVQSDMWNRVKGTPQYLYVSNPANGGGLHNYGAAVDLTLADENGNPLPMGTPFDYFGAAAHIDHEDELVACGQITRQELDNRLLLRKVMQRAGFHPLRSEWWHFNAMTRAEACKGYRAIE